MRAATKRATDDDWGNPGPPPDAAEIERIVRTHNRRMFRIARAILRDDAEAEDVVQEAYVQGFLRLGQFRGDGLLEGWFARIAVNLARARLRQRTRRAAAGVTEQPLDDAMIDQLPSPDGMTPEHLAAAAELRCVLEGEIDALPDGFREVFMLRAVEGMSIDETAALLQLLPATVKTRLHRARTMLQRALSRRLVATAADVFPFAGARCDRIVARVLARLAAEDR